jgi:hypothetical protein
MLKTNYGAISKENYENYFKFLIGKFYKILPLKESNCITLNKYLKSLQRELIGNAELLIILKTEPQFMSLLHILEFFINEEFDNATCKYEVNKAISIVQKINTKYFMQGGEISGLG